MHGSAPPELIDARQAGLFSVPAVATAKGGGGRTRLRPESPALTPTGTWHIPVLLVYFSDQAPRFQPARFKTLLFDTTAINPHGSMAEYYKSVSRGALRITGDVIGWFALPQPESYYADNGYGLSRTNFPQNIPGLVWQAIQEADSTVNFAQYDRDGDGEVDYLLVVHVGVGAEANSGDRNTIWSINTAFSGPWDRVTPYITNDLIPGSTTQHIRIDHFSILPERSWIDPDSMAEVGPYCHEFGHGLGWPDLYDTSVIGGGAMLGPGDWCLMSSGAYGGDDRSPWLPTRPCAWCIMDAGWLPATNLTQSRSERFPPVANTDGQIYRLWWQGEPSTEYFLMENRQRTGFDANEPNGGLLVYHVMDDIIASRRSSNLVNAGTVPGLRLEEADGQYDLTVRANRGDWSDPFPDSLREPRFGDDTTPSTRTYDGRHTDLELSQITRDGDDIDAWVQLSPFGWSAPAATTLPGRLRSSGDRPMTRSGSNLDFLLLNDADSSRVYLLRRQFDVSWNSPVKVSTASGASDPTWSDPVAGPRIALWADHRVGNSQIFERDWDGNGPETQLTYSSAFAFRPSGTWLPGGKFCLIWLDTRKGKAQLFAKIFLPGQQGAALETQVSSDSLTPEVVEYAMAGTPDGHIVVAYTGRGSSVDEVYWQRFYPASLSWSTPFHLSDLDGYPSNSPDVLRLSGGLVRVAWRDNTPTRTNFISFEFDPAQDQVVASPPASFGTALPVATMRLGTGPSTDRSVLAMRASEPPNDRLMFAAEHDDQAWDVGLGTIAPGTPAAGSDPIADVTDDGTVTFYWIDEGSTTSQAWFTRRQITLAEPVAVPHLPAPRPLSILAAPNPAVSRVRFTWSGAPAGSTLALYSPAGRVVARFPGEAGVVEWSGRDALGLALAPGMYFYRLEDAHGLGLGTAGKLVWLR
jgi:immune inhibitor A